MTQSQARQRGIRAFAAHNLDDAARWLDQAIAESPEDPVALHYQGLVSWLQGDHGAALQQLADAVELGPPDESVRSNQLATARDALVAGAARTAVALLEPLLVALPDDVEVACESARGLLLLGEVQRALAILDGVSGDESERVWLYRWVGECRMGAGEVAQRSLAMSLEIAPPPSIDGDTGELQILALHTLDGHRIEPVVTSASDFGFQLQVSPLHLEAVASDQSWRVTRLFVEDTQACHERLDQAGDYDVVVNCVSDPVRASAALEVLRRRAIPMVNAADAVMCTSRVELWERLRGLAGVRIAPAMRLTVGDQAASATGQIVEQVPLPVSVDVAGGADGGGVLARDLDELLAVVGTRLGQEVLVTTVPEHRAKDGLSRRYRMACIDGEWVATELLVGNSWNVRAADRDEFMADNPRLLAEERAFLAAPEAVLTDIHQQALEGIRGALRLDVFSVEFDLFNAQELQVFEVSAELLCSHRAAGLDSPTAPIRSAVGAHWNRFLRRCAAGDSG